MKPIINMTVFMLLFFSLTMTANAGTATTTTTTTTVTTVKKISCHQHTKKHVKHKKQVKHRCYQSSRSPCPVYIEYDYGNNQCPGGAYDCYYDLQGNYYRQSYLPITPDNNVKYACLASDDPASCS